MMNKIVLNARAFFLLLLALILSLYGAWMVNAQLGYGYSWLYEFYQTEEHIAHYAPQNKFRKGFEATTVEEHKAVFQKIVDSVHNNGVGLGDIQYEYQGQAIGLLHRAERVHLQDVANLINNIHYLVWLCAAIFTFAFVWEYHYQRGHQQRASALGLFAVFALMLALISLLFFMWGAKAIFYQMHILIFPADHQWFFYYQDSLMSTLMKAPDLFAGIALQIVFLALFFYAALLWAMQQLLKRGRATKS